MSWSFQQTNSSVANYFPRSHVIAAILAIAISNSALNAAAPLLDETRLAWPRTGVTATGERVTFSQPQVDEWSGGIINAKFATQVQLTQASPVVQGTVNVRARTSINRGNRTVTLRSITVPALRFPTDENQIKALRDAVTTALQNTPITVGFDDLAASMPAPSFPTPTSTTISDTPPRIGFRESLVTDAIAELDPSIEIIQSDGALKFAPIIADHLDGATNSSSLLFRDHDGTYYALISGRWLTADALDSSSWTFLAPSHLPTAFASIPESSQWAEALASVPNTPASRLSLLAATIPTQRILPRSAQIAVEWRGDPNFLVTDAPDLSCATNANALVLHIGGAYYCCLDAAWFTASTPQGPWSLCTKTPPHLATLSPESPIFPLRFVEVLETSPTKVTSLAAFESSGGVTHDGVEVYGTGFAIPQALIRAGSLPAPTYGFGMWWNPWTLSWTGNNVAGKNCAGMLIDANSTPESLTPNPAEENHFVGLDGRVYANRGDSWFRSTPSGTWTELTEKRSTLRVLRSDLAARQAAIATRHKFFEWIAKQADLKLKSTDGCDRISSMDSVRPSTAGYRCAPETDTGAPTANTAR